MNALDDSSRATYRADLLDEVHYERFGPIPWIEVYARPAHPPRPVVRRHDPPRVCARRRAKLNAAMVEAGVPFARTQVAA